MRSRRSERYTAILSVALFLGLLWAIAGDPWIQARSNARDSEEAVSRIRSYISYTRSTIDPATGLFPREASSTRRWLPKDNAADDLPYAVIASNIFGTRHDRKDFDRVLAAEKKLTTRPDGLADDYSIDKRAFIGAADPVRAYFNTAEYIKDGLSPIVDAIGPENAWGRRMVELAQAAMPFTASSRSEEADGDLIQAYTRMFWLTGDRAYLDSAETLADRYLFERPIKDEAQLKLRDHGDESIVGISELYFALANSDPAAHEKYKKPVHDLFDAVLARGLNDQGLVLTFSDTKHAIGERLTDNWGYIMNAVLTVGLVDGDSRYAAAASSAVESVSRIDDYDWEPGHPIDGLADTIESAITLSPYIRSDRMSAWIDAQMPKMWRLESAALKKGPDYLYGNAARTDMLYALMKSQDLRLDPWPSHTGLGAARLGDSIYIALSGPQDRLTSTRLKAVPARHSNVWNMPENYPRLNALPEWFTAIPGSEYEIGDPSRGSHRLVSGDDLIRGIEVSFSGEAKLLITKVSK